MIISLFERPFYGREEYTFLLLWRSALQDRPPFTLSVFEQLVEEDDG